MIKSAHLDPLWHHRLDILLILSHSFYGYRRIPPNKGTEIPTERKRLSPLALQEHIFFPIKHRETDFWVSSVEFWGSLNSGIIWIFPLQRSFVSYKPIAFHKYKETVVNSNCSSHTGIFSMDDYKKANDSTKTLLLLKIHIGMMNWQNTKEINPVTSTAFGEFQMIPGRCETVISILHSELIFAMSAFHTRERLELFLLPL